MLFHKNLHYIFAFLLSVSLLNTGKLDARGGGGERGGGGMERGGEARMNGGNRMPASHPNTARNFSGERAAEAAPRNFQANDAARFDVRPNPNFEVNGNRDAVSRDVNNNVNRDVNRDLNHPAVDRAAAGRALLNRDGYWGGYWGDGAYYDSGEDIVVPATSTNPDNPDFSLETDEDNAIDTNNGSPTNNPDFSLEQDTDDAQDDSDGSMNPSTGQPE